MRKIRIVKSVEPELVATITMGEDRFLDYACPECGMGVAMEYFFCPYCGVRLDWKNKRKC